MAGDVTPEMVFQGWGALRGASGYSGGWPTAVIRGHTEGTRIELGEEVESLVLRFGQSGVLRANDVRGEALQEVRVFDFANWPKDMGDRDRRRMRKVMHSPQWCLISANGGKVCKPVTGKWYWERDGAEFQRLKRLPIAGEVTA